MQRLNQDSNYTKEVYLTTVTNSIEAETLEALLQANNIPVLKKFREAGAYLEIYMGTSNFGVDIYVPSDLLDKAQDIMGGTADMEEEAGRQELEDDDSEEAQSNYKGKRRALTWLMLLIVLPGVLWIAIFSCIQIYRWFTA
ncbi:MAG: hypothetical protein K0R50_4391 [Eubacterium sp.]|jgi:hypothetical protein|nr:hypothetical protein [Eubacterium sp.]